MIPCFTDVKSSNTEALKKIAAFFSDFSERFIPQIYSPEEFAQVLQLGYRNIIWTLYRYPYRHDSSRILSQIRYWNQMYNAGLFAVAMPAELAERRSAEPLAEAGVPVYAHTVNTCKEFLRLARFGVSSIYTDSLDIRKCFDGFHDY